MRRFTQVSRLIVLVLIATGLFACEDDPILDQGPANSPGGSYGRLGIPDSTGKYPAPSVTNRNNPEVF